MSNTTIIQAGPDWWWATYGRNNEGEACLERADQVVAWSIGPDACDYESGSLGIALVSTANGIRSVKHVQVGASHASLVIYDPCMEEKLDELFDEEHAFTSLWMAEVLMGRTI